MADPADRRPLPRVVPLPALEALARGEVGPPLGEQFDTEDDSDLFRWRTPRERVSPVEPADAVLWDVLERWDFGDADGWVQLLADAAGDAPDRRAGEQLRVLLARFAGSDARAALAAAHEVNRTLEFLADLAEFGPPVKVHGVIDLLYRDAGGWHVLGIDRGTASEDDPWRGRRPGLVLQAWAASRTLGVWPATVGLFDLATGQAVRADPRRFPLPAVAGHFLRGLNRLRE